MVNPVNNMTPTQLYESRRTRAKVDFVVRKVAIATIVTINLAAIAGVYVYIVQYTPIQPTALLNVSFFIGVLTSLKDLDLPTFGVNAGNVFQFVNPVTLAGRTVTYLLFAPTLWCMQNMDANTNYSDRIRANEITHHLEDGKFEEVAKRYGSHIGNLQKYGFITKDTAKKMRALYKDYQSVLKRQKALKKYEEIVVSGNAAPSNNNTPSSSAAQPSTSNAAQPSTNPLVTQFKANRKHLEDIQTIWKLLQDNELRGKLPNPVIQ